MEFYSRYFGDHLVFRVKDMNLDNVGTLRFKRELSGASSFNEEVKNIILDLQDVTFNDNTSFSALMLARRFTLGKGGRVILITPKPKVINLIKLAKLESAFEIINTDEEYKKLIDDLVAKFGEEEDVDLVLGEYGGSEGSKAPKKYDFDDDFKFVE